MCHGTFDIDTKWSSVYSDSSLGRTDVSTPTDNNYSSDNKNAPEYTGVLGFNFNKKVSSNKSLYFQLDFVGLVNPDNVNSANFEGDIQLSVGASLLF